ncbi:DUF3592 domain-containing protein [Amycolatopsis antarctica]|nr:DUF3592 domain-containing protein [Amycolatopsis antarctica]
MEIPVVMWLVFGGFAVGGVCLAVQGWRIGRQSVKTPGNWLPTQGVVVRYHWKNVARTGNRDQLAFPVVQYAGPDGRHYEFISDVTIDTGIYRTGKQVGILVDPRAPGNARLASADATVKTTGCLFGVLGCGLAGIGLVATAIFLFVVTR